MARYDFSDELLSRIARRFKTLGELSRLQLLMHLINTGEMTVRELVEASGQHQANVSKHLNLLAREDFVARRKQGLNAYYRIKDPSIQALCTIVCDRLVERSAEERRVLEGMEQPG